MGYVLVESVGSVLFVCCSSHLLAPPTATCMGFELLNVLVAEDPSVLTAGFNSENLTLPLDFTPQGPFSRMLAGNRAVVDILANQPVAMNNHHSGVAPTAFSGSSKLSSMFDVVSTNKDRDGREFISTIEAKTMPIYATQWSVAHTRAQLGSVRRWTHPSLSVCLFVCLSVCLSVFCVGCV